MQKTSRCIPALRGDAVARRATWLLSLPFALLLAACDVNSVLDVSDPDIVAPENLAGEAGLSTLRAGALGDFALALAGAAAGHGATPGLIHYTSSFTDEITYSGTFPTRREFDERRVQERNGGLAVVYRNMHRARAAAENAAAQLEQFSPNLATDPRVAEMRSIAGFSYLGFGENFCSGVPISTAPENGDLIFGEPQTTPQLFESAITWFDQALANTGSSADQASLARVGRGRALLNLGRRSEAAAAVAAVPTSFVYFVEYSSNTRRQTNGVYHLSAVDPQYSVSDQEAGEGLPFRSPRDSRVPWSRTEGEVGQDGSTPFFQQLKYPNENAPVPLATGIEARLIEAEAQLEANPTDAFLTLNTLRASQGLAPLAPAATPQGRVDQLFGERAFWLYLTAHRLGDLRRLVRQYNRASTTVFPSGAYFKGGSYGPDVNFIVPVDERNNPKFTGCIDRNP